MTGTMTVPVPHAPSSHPLDGVYVLHGCPLRPGVRLEQTSRFADAQWRLGPAMVQAHERPRILNFALVPERYATVTKELCYGMLSGPLPENEDRPSLQSVLAVFAELRRFFTWLDQRPHSRCTALATLTGADLSDYQRHLLIVMADKPVTRNRARAAIRRLWRWRPQLHTDRLAFDPAHIDGWGEPRRQRRSDNTTQRIDEPVLGALFTWSLRFVDDFSADITAAYHHWLDHSRATKSVVTTPRTMDVVHRLQRLLDAHRAQHRPLPGYRGRPNRRQIARLLGCDPQSLNRYSAEITAVARAVGVSTGPALNTAITGQLEDRPWIEAITTDTRSPTHVGLLARMLQTACYIVIAYLSGMRDGEIKHLRCGCLRIDYDEAARPYRWKLDSRAFKGEGEREGVAATWCVGQPVARAIDVLHTLQPASTEFLFACTNHGPQPRTQTPGRALSTLQTNAYLNEFTAWIKRHCADHDRFDAVPEVHGQPWRLSTRQFRRTLAWFIARRSGGAIAGALAYRHHSIHVFEGYAGTRDSGFRAEVESEQALARGEGYLAMIEAHTHTGLRGPAAAEAAQRLEDFGHRAGFQGRVITDEHRLRRLLARHDPAVYPGTYTTCVHDHTKALCTKAQHGRAEQLPDHGGCKPLACRNVALTAENITAWAHEIDLIDQRLNQTPAPPPLLEHQMRQRRQAIVDFLATSAAPSE